MTTPSVPETHAVSHELSQIKNALRLMIETQRTQTEMLAKLIEAATPSDEPHPLEEAMAGVATALRDQTSVLERVETEIGGLGAEVEAGVMRGLAGVLSVDGPSEFRTRSQRGQARSKPEKSTAALTPAQDRERRSRIAPPDTGTP